MPKEIKNTIYLTVLIIIIFLASKMIESEFFYINKITVKSENKLLKEDIISKFDEFKNKSIFFVDIDELNAEILKDIRVKEVDISKLYPNELVVNIVERNTKVYIKEEDVFYIADENLNIFAKIDEVENKDIMTVYYDEESKEEITKILKSLIDSKLYNLTSELYKNENEEYNYTIILEDGVIVMLNKFVDTKKFNQAYIVYNKEKEIGSKLEYIDLRFESITVK